MAEGEAAGIAAGLAINGGIGVKGVDTGELLSELGKNGARLK
jgi:hypothetical protein